MNIIPYDSSYFDTVQWYMESLQDFLAQVDPEKSLRREPGFWDAYTRNLLEKISKNGVLYLALENNTVLGMIAGNTIEQTELEKLWDHKKKIGTILELIVDTESQWAGVGTALMKRLEKYFRDQNCTRLTLECFIPNTKAYNFYKKHGYCDRSVYMTKTLS
jgi:ribosomal protein S18 acetylase RimI-like enzyme